MEFEKLQMIIAEVLSLKPEDIRMDMSFVEDLGADSMEIFQIAMGIEEEFDIAIDEAAAAEMTTVEQAYLAITEQST